MTRKQLADFLDFDDDWASAEPGLTSTDWLGERWEIFFEVGEVSYSPTEEQEKFCNSTAGWVDFHPVTRPEPDSGESSPRGKSFKIKLRDLSKRKLVEILKK